MTLSAFTPLPGSEPGARREAKRQGGGETRRDGVSGGSRLSATNAGPSPARKFAMIGYVPGAAGTGVSVEVPRRLT